MVIQTSLLGFARKWGAVRWYFEITGSAGKSLSKTLIFASTNPQSGNSLIIESKVQYMKITSSNLGRTCCVSEIMFLIFRTILVHNMFPPCSAKRKASDKDLPVRSKVVTPSLMARAEILKNNSLVFCRWFEDKGLFEINYPVGRCYNFLSCLIEFWMIAVKILQHKRINR